MHLYTQLPPHRDRSNSKLQTEPAETQATDSTSMAPTTSGGGGGGHVRSASVPSQRHPLVRHVDDQLRALRAWTADPARHSCPLSLAHVRALLCVLDELLLSLHSSSISGSLLLDAFLALADAYGSFLAALLALRHHAADLRAALRRRRTDDDTSNTNLASAARALRRAAKDLAALAARCAHTPVHHAGAGEDGGELTGTVAEAIGDTAAASAAVFLQVASLADAAAAMAMASSSSSSSSATSSSPPPKKKRLATLLAHAPARSGGLKKAMEDHQQQQRDAAAAAVEKLRELEQCVGELEGESEKVFRSLLQTRVFLLNIHTPTI